MTRTSQRALGTGGDLKADRIVVVEVVVDQLNQDW
jgi:hypothetical protein